MQVKLLAIPAAIGMHGKKTAVSQGSMAGPTRKDFGDKLIAGLVWLKYIGVCSCWHALGPWN